ncbi:hypothetical protein EJMOOK_10415 [Rhodanobacter sp. Root179]
MPAGFDGYESALLDDPSARIAALPVVIRC